jgi:tRNA threonylcarbamoyl adenosine modification protein YjeE
MALSFELLDTIKSESEIATIVTAASFVESHYSESACLLILLSGELGAGKTHFTKGVGKGMAISSTVKSPSFTYMMEHEFADSIGSVRKLIHWDWWRLAEENVIHADIAAGLQLGNVVVIEWWERFPQLVETLINQAEVKLNVFKIDFFVSRENIREIQISSVH